MSQPNVRRLLVLAGFLAAPAAADAQERPQTPQATDVVTGRVFAASTNRPLSGVQVSVPGTTVGTLTGNEGNFSLAVPPEADSLVFTYIGYRTTSVPIQPEVQVALEEEALGLEGIVVTALGVEREKRSLGYSVQDVQGAQLTDVPETNLVDALHGEVAGLQVTNAGPTGGTSRIVIRGASSITGDNQPLFIVDGIPVGNQSPLNDGLGGIDYGNAVQDIALNDVQAVSVLKGPNAAALYGSRAANGAIVVTTKEGGGGESQGLGITATTSLMFDQPLRLPEYQNRYGQGVNGEFGFVDGAGAGLWDFVDESWGPRMDGQPIDQFTGPGMPFLPQPDNVREFFRTGTQWNTNVAIARASENAQVRLSLTNSIVEGMAPRNGIDWISAALKGGATVTERLRVDGTVTYINLNGENRVGTGYDEDNPMQSFVWFGRQVDMDALRNYRCDGTEPTPCLPGAQYNWNYNYHNNPFWEQLVNTNADERDRVIGGVEANYQLTDWLTLTGRAGRDWYREHRKRNTAFFSLDDAGDGGFEEDTRFVSETNADLLVSATRALTSDVTLSATAGGNLRTNEFEFADVDVTALAAGDVFTIDNAAVTPNPGDFLQRKKVRGVYGSASLNYAGYLNLDVTGRNDWSSTLPEGNRSYFYPSVSAAFVFTDVLGLESDILSSGKVRASWTQVGNDTEPYQLASVMAAQQAWGSVPLYGTPDTLANPDLKPERTTSWEVGADLGFFNERAGFVLTYYDSKTEDQIMPVQVSPTTGFSSQLLNAGTMRNRGVELLLRATPIEIEDGLTWDMTVNWARNDSEVESLHEGRESLVLGTYWSLNIEAREGEPYGVLFGNGYLRDEQGRLMLSEEGIPLVDPNRRILGHYSPDWNAGIQNRFSYGPFSLSVLVDGQRGGHVFAVTNWFGEYAGVLESTLRGREEDWCTPGIVESGVLPDGSINGDGVDDVAVCPMDYFHANFGNQEAGIDDASYIKLREMRLGFELPTGLMDRIGFSSGSVALIGRNLAMWSEIDNIDPETAFDASNVQGIEFGQFPTARSLGFSLTIRP